MKRVRLLLCAIIALFVCAFSASAEDKPVLKWGGDSEGNVPYMFMEPDSENKHMIGFEIDIVNALAERMGKEEYRSYITVSFDKASNQTKNLFVDYLEDLDTFFNILPFATTHPVPDCIAVVKKFQGISATIIKIV